MIAALRENMITALRGLALFLLVIVSPLLVVGVTIFEIVITILELLGWKPSKESERVR